MKKYFRSIFKKITVSLSFLLLAGYLYQCKAETDNVERPRWDDSSASLNSESSPTPVSSLTSAAASSSALDSSAATVSSVQSSSVIPSQKINPCGVSASTNQTTNIPEHTLDGLLNTRWSAEGIGEWIEYDLCQQTTLGSVKISWYNGDLRRSSCEIAVSDNGVSWNIIYSLQSSGTTTALENYDFTDTNASFLRLVGYGNTENNWNSINEVEIWTADDHGTSSSSGSSADSSTSSSGAIVIDQTGFEGYSDEYTFTESTWTAEGFDPRWVNGFDQNRAHIDTAHSCVGNAALRIDYPAGTYRPGDGGAQAPLQFSGENEVYVSYYLYFSANFDWGGSSEGGKLPGLAADENCSGGDTCDGSNGFTARLMWRSGGQAVLYLYHMDKPGTYGEDFALSDAGGDIHFNRAQCYHIRERVKINTGNNFDGEVQIWIDGEDVLSLSNIRFVNDGTLIDNFYFSTFHGGGDSDWAPSVDCSIWFDDIKIYKY